MLQSSAIKLDKKIVGYSVKSDTPEVAPAPVAAPEPVKSVELSTTRPEVLKGSTYKIKSPVTTDALYITINDIVINPGEPNESRRPFEVFLNSKNMEHYQWIVALTRVMSAVFRKGGDVTFLVEELKSVFDPRGGYFKKGGKFVPSLIGEIGDVLEQHLMSIGLIQKPELDATTQAILAEKRAQYEERTAATAASAAPAAAVEESSGFPAGAQLCKKCNTKAAILMDGCMTCLNCGDSKCG